MPTYQYQCSSCGHELEEFQSMKEAALTTCPECKGETLLRIMGAGSGLIFKGSGFYLTDYRKEGKPSPPAKEEKKSPGSGGSPGGSSPGNGGSPGGSSPPAEKK